MRQFFSSSESRSTPINSLVVAVVDPFTMGKASVEDEEGAVGSSTTKEEEEEEEEHDDDDDGGGDDDDNAAWWEGHSSLCALQHAREQYLCKHLGHL